MFKIAIHGGAGSLSRATTSFQEELAYQQGLADSLDAGYHILAQGGSALDAVELAVISLENNPLFNAGKGAVFTADQTHELDAAVMCGAMLKAGAVAGVHNVRNPVQLARAVMERSENVLLAAAGAEAFARHCGLTMVNENYFFAQHRHDELMEAQQKAAGNNVGKGTVGAVAIDSHGNLAAATSTGGLTNKQFGRVGDTPVIGGGTYANNATCAVSCTGDGEFMIRLVCAYDVSCLIEYAGMSLQAACDEVIQRKLTALGGEGGLIAVDATGNFELVFNCESMLRGWKDDSGSQVLIWPEGT